MSVTELSAVLCQMTSVDDIDDNLMQIETLLEAAVQLDPKIRLVCFPENCLYMRLVEGEAVRGLDAADEVFVRLGAWAREHGCYLHLGALPLRVDGHLYNSSVLITDAGVVRPSYQKMHLFDIQLEGQKALRESDVFRHGQGPEIFEIDGWKFGQSVCYDLRFAELYAMYARREVDAILVPSAFLVKTGQAHWEVLLRARAVESQCYVLAAAQAGTHLSRRGGVRETYGHSMAVDPWGAVLTHSTADAPGVQLVRLSRARIEQVRRQIPMKDHRRLPLGR